MVITFDRELGLRRAKNERCSNWGNEALSQPAKAVGPPEIPKFYRLNFFFFCYFLSIFLDCSFWFHISTLAKKF